MDKRKKILSRILLNSKFLAFLGLAIIVFISFPIAKNISQRRSVNGEVRELKQEIKFVENKNTKLQKLISYLNSDQYVEEQARLNFGLKKAGEKAIVVDTNGIGGGQANSADEGNFQNAEDLNLSDNKPGNELVKSIYNISEADKSKSEETIINPEKWRKYFFGNL